MRVHLKLQKRSELWPSTAQRWQEVENGVELGWRLFADSSEGVLKMLLISVHGMCVFRPQLSAALARRVKWLARKTHFEPRRLTQPVAQQCLNVIVKPP